MIHQISIRNYQSLRSVDLILGKVTVIVGHSDSGKSAALRAAQALVYNQEGNEFLHRRRLSDGSIKVESPAAVAFVLVDGSTIVWKRYEKEQLYVLSRKDGTKEEFRKTGGEVPTEISNLFGIVPVLIEEKKKERIHFSFQYDKPFLVADRGGVSANRVLGRLTGLHVFANAAKQCAQSKSEVVNRLRSVIEQRDKTALMLKSLPDVTKVRILLDEINSSFKLLETKSSTLAKLKELSTKLQSLVSQKGLLEKKIQDSKFLTHLNSIDRLDASVITLDQYVKWVEKLRTLILQRNQLLKSVKEVKDLPSLDLWQRLSQTKTKLEELLQSRASLSTSIKLLDQRIQESISALEAFQVANPKCLMCGSPWKDERRVN